MAIAAVLSTTIAIATRLRFGFVSSRVVLGDGGAGSAVVGPVERSILGVVDVCGRMPVSISLAADVVPSFAVPASLLNDAESLTSAVPSARQKTSASSVSTRLHWGQRFIGW